jgi:hypothetical protein
MRDRGLVVSRVKVGSVEVDVVGERRTTLPAPPPTMKDVLEQSMVSAQEKADDRAKTKDAALSEYERTLFMASEG